MSLTSTCPIHNVTMLEREGKFGPFFSHIDGDGWCQGKPKNGFQAPLAKPKVEKSSFNTCNAMNNAVALIVGGKVDIEKLEECYDRILKILEK